MHSLTIAPLGSVALYPRSLFSSRSRSLFPLAPLENIIWWQQPSILYRRKRDIMGKPFLVLRIRVVRSQWRSVTQLCNLVFIRYSDVLRNIKNINLVVGWDIFSCLPYSVSGSFLFIYLVMGFSTEATFRCTCRQKEEVRCASNYTFYQIQLFQNTKYGTLAWVTTQILYNTLSQVQ